MSASEYAVGLCQYGLAGVDGLDALLDRAEGLLEAAGPADCYVLPELFAVDATDPAADAFAELALTADEFGALTDWCAGQASARDALVVGGSAYVDDGGLVNRCPVGRPDGTAATYDKRCPIPSEREGGVVGGEAAPPVVEHRGTGVGVLVCYDVEFPGQVRDLVDRGAEVLVVPSWTAGADGYERVGRCAAARAVENQAYVVQVSLVGTHPAAAVGGGVGRSAVFAPCDDVHGPHGTRLALAHGEHAAGRYALDLDALERSRAGAAVRPYTDAEELP